MQQQGVRLQARADGQLVDASLLGVNPILSRSRGNRQLNPERTKAREPAEWRLSKPTTCYNSEGRGSFRIGKGSREQVDTLTNGLACNSDRLPVRAFPA